VELTTTLSIRSSSFKVAVIDVDNDSSVDELDAPDSSTGKTTDTVYPISVSKPRLCTSSILLRLRLSAAPALVLTSSISSAANELSLFIEVTMELANSGSDVVTS